MAEQTVLATQQTSQAGRNGVIPDSDGSTDLTGKKTRPRHRGPGRLVLAWLLVTSTTVSHAAPWELEVSERELKDVADGILTLMSFTVLPDVTISSLTIKNASQNDPGLKQVAFGGGFTVSDKYPLYLEGPLGWSRFDPEFVATDGVEERRIPFKWNSFSATGGIGWSFPLDAREELKLRPIFNFTLGRATTDANILQSLANELLDTSFEVVKDQKMDAYGLGDSIMLDYERYREDYEVDIELRYTNIQPRTFGSTSAGIRGESESNTGGLWARWGSIT